MKNNYQTHWYWIRRWNQEYNFGFNITTILLDNGKKRLRVKVLREEPFTISGSILALNSLLSKGIWTAYMSWLLALLLTSFFLSHFRYWRHAFKLLRDSIWLECLSINSAFKLMLKKWNNIGCLDNCETPILSQWLSYPCWELILVCLCCTHIHLNMYMYEAQWPSS